MNPNLKKLMGFIPAVLLFLTGMAIRYSGLDFMSIDMQGFLLSWYEKMAADGFASLREPFSNYSPPYLYLLGLAALTESFLPKVIAIKLISIFFDICNGFLIYKILKIRYPQGGIALLGAVSFLLLPTILLNSAFWGQADAIYTCFLLVCLYFLMKDQPLPAMIFLGISFSFKAQAVFLSPLLLLLAVRKRIPWFYFGLIPIVYIIMMVPAMLTGRPFLDLMTIYASQASAYHFLTLYAPNLYTFIPDSLYTSAVAVGVVATILLVCTWTAIYAHKVKQFTSGIILLCAFVSVAIVPFSLPKMHDRYFYLTDVLSLLVAFYFLLSRLRPPLIPLS